MNRRDANTRIRVIARAESCEQAANHLGLSNPDTVRRWLHRDHQRLRRAVRAAHGVVKRQQRRIFEASKGADFEALRKLERRLVNPWVIGYAERSGIRIDG